MPADELSILELLGTADLDIEGRMPWSSNATFLARLVVDGAPRGQAIYKPVRGERPLWDFEPGLHRREVAAYRLSAAMGLGVIPPTVLRDGPLGEGSAQWFVDADHSQHYFTIFEARTDVHDQLRAIAAFDVVANNTDRKSGHVLIDGEGRVWGIDNGLCFAEEFKLRTVVWEFGGEPLPDALRGAIASIADAVPDDVAELLADDEVAALAERARLLADGGTFPVDPSGRRYPWPLV
ncbi:MAG: SCO1664 family protein [Ilumatobacteraceae bacterium]